MQDIYGVQFRCDDAADAMLGLNPNAGTDNSWQALDANGYYFYCHPLQVIAVDSL